jgi:hypothetical protein
MEDGGFEIEICLAERPPTNAFRYAIKGTEDLDFFYQPELATEEIAESAVRTENVIDSYSSSRKTKARVSNTNFRLWCQTLRRSPAGVQLSLGLYSRASRKS